MNNHYHHTQVGYVIIIAFAISLICIGMLLANFGYNWIAVIVSVILVITFALFSTLTVEINETDLAIRFGPGLFRKKILISDIESCQIVKNPWYYGWGIRLTPHGWLYNVAGIYAVEIKLKSGKKYRIGTDVPNDLDNAIRKAIK